MNCLLYARASTDKQAQKDLSIPAQIAATSLQNVLVLSSLYLWNIGLSINLIKSSNVLYRGAYRIFLHSRA